MGSWDSTLDYFLGVKCVANFGLFGKDSHLTFVLHHFVCIMSVSLLDHRLQHGCPGRTKRTICLLSASMDYPAQDHPAWGRCFSIPLLPAAAEPGRRRWIISSLLRIRLEFFTILLRNISNKILVCCLTLLAEGSRGLCKHHFLPERRLIASWSIDSDLTQFRATLIFTNFFLPVSPDTPMLPSSLMLLNTAHEYLGRRSWCCNSDGALLKFYVSISIVE